MATDLETQEQGYYLPVGNKDGLTVLGFNNNDKPHCASSITCTHLPPPKVGDCVYRISLVSQNYLSRMRYRELCRL